MILSILMRSTYFIHRLLLDQIIWVAT